jgi:Zn-dependent protease
VIGPRARRLAPRAPAVSTAAGSFSGLGVPRAGIAGERTLLGTPITVDATWLLGLGLAAWTFADGVLPAEVPGRRTSAYVAAGTLAALLLLGSLVLHETGHWLAARRAGLPVTGLRLSLVGGALTLGAVPRTPAAEARIAVAGPLASLATAVVAALAHVVMVEAGADALAATVPAIVATGNVGLALVNLVPGLPLDGGRLLRAGLWRMTGDLAAATRVAGRLGRTLAGGLVGLAVIASASGDAAAATWAAMVALAIYLNAAAPA